ncbi:DUF1330 domain-containing protein [Chryseobacterium hispalense]|uniref:DUF1330 domain-containing protein n=1 Tax=Chryseobacterium hispalense TaxID=1453492 RepID=UPI0016081F7F|nr:DUF1330 domain-containing protein [Chryseobacterium hispalense]
MANYTVDDSVRYLQYRKASEPIIGKYNGKVVIYDADVKTLEGNPQNVIDVVEFPTVGDAEKYYNSEEYAPIKKLRAASTKGWVLLATSTPPSEKISGTAGQSHGYQIVNYTINDQATFQKYMDAAGPLSPKFGGGVPIFDMNCKALEGNPGKIFGVAEFPTPSDANRFYKSPEYTAAKKFRIASTENSITILASFVPNK